MKIKKRHIKKGDLVKVIAGKNKGVIGKITAITLKNSTVFLENIPSRIKSEKGSVKKESNKIEIQIPLHFSNVMLWDDETKRASRIGYKILEKRKIRYFKKSGNIVK